MVDKYSEQQLASIWNFNFKNAMIAKNDYVKRWQTYWDAYNGDYFKNISMPDYKSNMVSNYIYSIVETIRPIMLDQNPQFQAVALQPEGRQFVEDVQEAMSYEWDREEMTKKLSSQLITMLVTGTSVFFVPWDAKLQRVRYIPVNPYNIFPDPLATSVDDAEYIIYASYKNAEVLRRLYPERSDKLTGSSINYSELVNDVDLSARINNQILVLEVYTRDYDNEELQHEGVKLVRPKYPNGRCITVCPTLGVVLDDKAIPYTDKKFPFILIKDVDMPDKFWGEGEVVQLISPQKYMNELSNAIIDNAKTTANAPWIIDKNSGIGTGKITSRPGLIIRKNPGTEVKREQPVSIPNYVMNSVEMFKSDMEEVSGIFNTVKGNSETGVYTAQGVLALQEAGQARIRLKVKGLEVSLAQLGRKGFSRMKQYWKSDRWIRVTRFDGSYDIKNFTKSILEYDYEIYITAGSTMSVNRGAMLDLMVRLAQTPMPDGMPLVDREAVAHFLPEEIKSSMLKRMNGGNMQMQEIIKAIQQLGQQFQQYIQQNEQEDSQVIDTVEQLTGAVEQIQKQIIQLQKQHDTMVEEQKKVKEMEKVKKNSYNSGYSDAEKNLKEPTEQPITEEADDTPLPDDVLEGLEAMSDDELTFILEKNPELIELINSEQSR